MPRVPKEIENVFKAFDMGLCDTYDLTIEERKSLGLDREVTDDTDRLIKDLMKGMEET